MTLAKKGSKAFLSKTLKFMFFKKATKNYTIFIADLTHTNLSLFFLKNGEDFVIFCGLLRKHELYQQNKHSTQLNIIVSAISANKTYYMKMMFLPLRGPPSFGWAGHSNHHLFHCCSHICTMTLNAQLLLCIPTYLPMSS